MASYGMNGTALTTTAGRLSGTLTAAPVLSASAAEALGAAMAPATRRSYAGAWAHFASWCQSEGRDAIPAAPETVADYLADLAADHKMATVRHRLTVINQAHEAKGVDSPGKTLLVRAVVRGIARQRAEAGERVKFQSAPPRRGRRRHCPTALWLRQDRIDPRTTSRWAVQRQFVLIWRCQRSVPHRAICPLRERSPSFRDRFGFAISSNDQRAVHVVSRLGTMMFHAALPVLAQQVKPDTVVVRIDDFEQAIFELRKLSGIHLAFKDRELYALPIIQTGFGYTTQSPGASFRRGRHIIGDNHIHRGESGCYFQTNGGYASKSPRR